MSSAPLKKFLLADQKPTLAESVFVAPGATVIGAVSLGDESSVWYGSVLRGEINRVIVGAQSNVQDLSVLHVSDDFAAIVGEKRSNGTPVPVNYTMRATPQGWKAWDITIEGISYVKNYRTDFGAEIDQKGIDAVIERLETQNATGKPDAPGTTPTAKAGR